MFDGRRSLREAGAGRVTQKGAWDEPFWLRLDEEEMAFPVWNYILDA